MEHYEKGEVVEVEDMDGPFLHMGVRFGDVITMKVRNGSKIRNLLTFAVKRLKEDETRSIIFSGIGQAVTKTVTCVEIMKKEVKNLHQVNKAYYRRIEEYWNPKEEGLDRLRVNRQVPALAVLLSKDPLDKNELGYQAPGSYQAKRIDDAKQDKKRKNTNKQNAKGDYGQKQRQPSTPKTPKEYDDEGNMGSRKRPNRRKKDQRGEGKRDGKRGGGGGVRGGREGQMSENRTDGSTTTKKSEVHHQTEHVKPEGGKPRQKEQKMETD